jgi:hypothetical protein
MIGVPKKLEKFSLLNKKIPPTKRRDFHLQAYD